MGEYRDWCTGGEIGPTLTNPESSPAAGDHWPGAVVDDGTLRVPPTVIVLHCCGATMARSKGDQPRVYMHRCATCGSSHVEVDRTASP